MDSQTSCPQKIKARSEPRPTQARHTSSLLVYNQPTHRASSSAHAFHCQHQDGKRSWSFCAPRSSNTAAGGLLLFPVGRSPTLSLRRPQPAAADHSYLQPGCGLGRLLVRSSGSALCSLEHGSTVFSVVYMASSTMQPALTTQTDSCVALCLVTSLPCSPMDGTDYYLCTNGGSKLGCSPNPWADALCSTQVRSGCQSKRPHIKQCKLHCVAYHS